MLWFHYLWCLEKHGQQAIADKVSIKVTAPKLLGQRYLDHNIHFLRSCALHNLKLKFSLDLTEFFIKKTPYLGENELTLNEYKEIAGELFLKA